MDRHPETMSRQQPGDSTAPRSPAAAAKKPAVPAAAPALLLVSVQSFLALLSLLGLLRVIPPVTLYLSWAPAGSGISPPDVSHFWANQVRLEFDFLLL